MRERGIEDLVVGPPAVAEARDLVPEARHRAGRYRGDAQVCSTSRAERRKCCTPAHVRYRRAAAALPSRSLAKGALMSSIARRGVAVIGAAAIAAVAVAGAGACARTAGGSGSRGTRAPAAEARAGSGLRPAQSSVPAGARLQYWG